MAGRERMDGHGWTWMDMDGWTWMDGHGWMDMDGWLDGWTWMVMDGHRWLDGGRLDPTPAPGWTDCWLDGQRDDSKREDG